MLFWAKLFKTSKAILIKIFKAKLVKISKDKLVKIFKAKLVKIFKPKLVKISKVKLVKIFILTLCLGPGLATNCGVRTEEEGTQGDQIQIIKHNEI